MRGLGSAPRVSDRRFSARYRGIGLGIRGIPPQREVLGVALPIRIPTEAEQRRREGTRRRQFLKREVRCLANRGHGQVAEYCHQSLPTHWWGPRLWKKLQPKLDPWLLGVLEKLRDLILALETQLQALEENLLRNPRS